MSDTFEAADATALARTLWEAERSRTSARGLRASRPGLTLAEAYLVQRAVDELRVADGDEPVGRKIGLASRELIARTDATEPFWARVFRGRLLEDGAALDTARWLRPRVEPEIAVVLGSDLPGRGVTREAARAAIHAVHPAFEIVDARTDVAGLDVIESVADSGWNAGCVLGPQLPAAGLDLDAVTMTLHSARDGELARGASTILMDGPAGCLAWLATRAAEAGLPLRASEIILTGTLGGAYPVPPGDTLTATFEGLGAEAVAVRVTGDASSAQ